MRSRTPLLVGLTALAAAVLSSCDRNDVYGPSTRESAVPLAPSQVSFRNMPGHPVDRPPRSLSVDEIQSAILKQGGLAFVGLKAPESSRSPATGYRAGLSAAAAESALKAVVATGAEVLNFYGAFGIALVRVSLDRVPLLDASPFVDFVEAAGTTPAVNSPVAAFAVPAGSPQSRVIGAPRAAMADVIPWGISQVNAPAAWSRATGSGVKVMLLGQGIVPHFDNPSVPPGNCGGLFNACSSYWLGGTMAMGNMLARENGQGVIGVAKGVAASDVYVWRIFTDGGNIDINSEISGLYQAINYGIKLVVNDISHVTFYQSEADAFAQAWNYGVITVSEISATGNGIYREAIYPASYSNVVGASGVKDDGQFAAGPVTGCTGGPAGSDFGPMVDVAAAFWSYTTFANNQGFQWFADSRADYGWCYNFMAAAHAAGVIAQVQAYQPSWPPALIVGAVQGTASNHASPNDQIGYGIPNANAALDYVPTTVLIHDGFAPSLNGSEMGDVTIYTNGGAAYSNLEDANGVYTEYSVSFQIASLLPAEDEALLQVTIYRNNGPGSQYWTEVAEEIYTVDDVGYDLCLNFNATLRQNWDIKVVVTRLGTTTAAEVIFWSELNDPSGVVFLRVG